MKKLYGALLSLLIFAILVLTGCGCCGTYTPTARQPTAPVASPTATATATLAGPTERPTPTDTPAPTRTPAPTPVEPAPTTPEVHAPVQVAMSEPEPEPAPATPTPAAVPVPTPVSEPVQAAAEEVPRSSGPLPRDIATLPPLRASDEVRYGLENMNINGIREPNASRPYGVAYINMDRVYINEVIPGTRARLIGLDLRGIAIEIVGTGERFFIQHGRL